MNKKNASRLLMEAIGNGHVSDLQKVLKAHRAGLSEDDLALALGEATVWGAAAIPLLETLVAAGAPLNPVRTGGKGVTPLGRAVRTGLVTTQWLLQAGADPNHVPSDSPHGRVPLMGCYRHHECVPTLVSAGADTEIPDRSGETAIFIAAASGDLDYVRALVDAGANVNARSQTGSTPLSRALGDTPRWEAVADCLVRAGADVNARQRYDFTVYEFYWYIAILDPNRRWAERMQCLIRAGAMVELSLQCQFFLSVREHRWADAQALLRSGADVNRVVPDGAPPLTKFASRGDLEAVRHLDEWGADINAVDAEGFSVLARASEAGYLDIVKYLVARGVDITYVHRTYLPLGPTQTPFADALYFAKSNHCTERWQQKMEVARYLEGALRSRQPAKATASRKAKSRQPAEPLSPKPAPTPAPATGRFATSRGVPTFEGTRRLILAAVPLDTVTERVAHCLGVETPKTDMWGKSVRVGGRCFAVWQFVGHPWTVVWPLGEDTDQDLQDLADELSTAIGGKATCFTFNDDPGDLQYSLYEKGKLRERFRYTDTGTVDALLKRSREFNGEQQEELKGLKKGTGMLLMSKDHKLPAREKVFEFVDQLVREQDAYIPPLQWNSGGAKRITLNPAGIEPQDIVRMDWISDR